MSPRDLQHALNALTMRAHAIDIRRYEDVPAEVLSIPLCVTIAP